MVKRLARMLAFAALAALGIPAHAVAAQSFEASGSITYTWQGDPARGCATVGVCGVQGALILGVGGGFSTSGGGPVRGLLDVPFNASGATVRVADGAGAGECVDQPASQIGGGDVLITRRGGRLVGRIEGALSSGRCAGPRNGDLAGVVLPVRRSGRGRVTYDLHTSQSFAVGPFSCRLVSTLVIRATPAGGSQSGSSGAAPVALPPPPPPPPRHKVLLEQVTLRYRLASLPGASVDVAFSGGPDPFCEALDSCGATGTLELTLPNFNQTLTVQASRPVARRVDARQVLADLRDGRLRPSGGEVGGPRPGITAEVAETVAGPGGARCQAASGTRVDQVFFTAGPSRSGRSVALVLNDPVDVGAFRTYCPGPSDIDVFGSGPAVARTSIGIAQLLARHSVVTLPLSGSFAGVGYVGTRSGALGFSLTRERIRAGTVEVTRP